MAPPVITITRQYASGGSDVARLVAVGLDWTVIDNEFVDQVAQRAGLPVEEVAQREERAPGLLERLARTLAVASPEMFIASATAPRVEQDEATIVKMTERVIAEAAAHGRIVLVGRGAQAGGAAAAGRFRGWAGGPPPAPSLATESAPPVAVMSFEPYGGLLYVHGVVNRDSAWLILDTGTSHTGLDREWAWTTGALPVAAPGAPAPQVAETASAAVVDTMHLAGLALPNYQVALYALRGVSEASGRPERGFVGHDVLRSFTVEIDYREQRVRLYDPARYHYAGSGTVVPFAAGDDRPLLHGSITVPGRPPIPARLLLDTGASGLCLILTVPFVERHGLAGAGSPAIEVPTGTSRDGPLRGTPAPPKEVPLRRLPRASPTTRLRGAPSGLPA